MNNYKEIKELYHSALKEANALYHHGIKGQKWGVRRFQNEDGTLTEEGLSRYGHNDPNDKKKAKDIPEIKNVDDVDKFCDLLKKESGIQQIDGTAYIKKTLDPKVKKDIDDSADIGLEALKKMGAIDTEWMNEMNKQDLREWFIFEDQTIGLIEIARLINAGYDPKQITKTFNILRSDKFVDAFYDNKYQNGYANELVFASTEGGRSDEFINKCGEIYNKRNSK